MPKKRTFKEFNEMLDRLQAADPLHGSKAVDAAGNMTPIFHGSPAAFKTPNAARFNPHGLDGAQFYGMNHPVLPKDFATFSPGDEIKWISDPAKLKSRHGYDTGYIHKFFFDVKNPLDYRTPRDPKQNIKILKGWASKVENVLDEFMDLYFEAGTPDHYFYPDVDEIRAQAKKQFLGTINNEIRSLGRLQKQYEARARVKVKEFGNFTPGSMLPGIQKRTLGMPRTSLEKAWKKVTQALSVDEVLTSLISGIEFGGSRIPPSLEAKNEKILRTMRGLGYDGTLWNSKMNTGGQAREYRGPRRMRSKPVGKLDPHIAQAVGWDIVNEYEEALNPVWLSRGKDKHVQTFTTPYPEKVYSWSSPEVQRAKRSRAAQRKLIEVAESQGIKLPKRKVGLFIAALSALAGMGYLMGQPQGEPSA